MRARGGGQHAHPRCPKARHLGHPAVTGAVGCTGELGVVSGTNPNAEGVQAVMPFPG